jgi:hypothetical protein
LNVTAVPDIYQLLTSTILCLGLYMPDEGVISCFSAITGA